MRKLLTLLALTLSLTLLHAPAALAQVAADDTVLLDPFDPVPQIGFHHGDCDDPCGYHRCHEGCYRHRSRCNDCCGRECDEEYWAYLWSLRRYEHETDTYNMLLDIYVNELKAYDRRYLNDFDEHAFEEWRRQFHDRVPHYGTADHRDGDGDWHDGDHHDGDHHDGDHGDGHDGDHHDGDSHDGDHHDGDGHDGDHDGDDHQHDGQWQDHDGNWHDGPPPDGYGH